MKTIKVRQIKKYIFVRAKPRTDPVTNIDFQDWRGKKTNVFLASISPPILFGNTRTFGTEFLLCRFVIWTSSWTVLDLVSMIFQTRRGFAGEFRGNPNRF